MTPTDITLEVLRGIQTSLVSLRDDVHGTREELQDVGRRVDENARTLETHGPRLDSVDRRLAQMVEVLGLSVGQHGDLRLRVDALEQRVGALEHG